MVADLGILVPLSCFKQRSLGFLLRFFLFLPLDYDRHPVHNAHPLENLTQDTGIRSEYCSLMMQTRPLCKIIGSFVDHGDSLDPLRSTLISPSPDRDARKRTGGSPIHDELSSATTLISTFHSIHSMFFSSYNEHILVT